MKAGCAGAGFTVIVIDWHDVIPQVPPSARTKYVVVPVGSTAKEEPVPRTKPDPQAFLYHFQDAPAFN
jgi:hypothetical protein